MSYGETADIAKLIGNYYCSEDTDMALHMIFSTLVKDTAPFTTKCVVSNLFRLLLEGWEPARTYLVMLTGTRVSEEEERGEEPAYFLDPYEFNVIKLNAPEVIETCFKHGSPLSDLQFGDDEEDDEDSTEYETDKAESESSSEEEEATFPHPDPSIYHPYFDNTGKPPSDLPVLDGGYLDP